MLKPKQRKFVDEYLIDLNAKRAAIRAGYATKAAAETGYKLINHPEVKALIEEKQKNLSETLGINAYTIAKRFQEIADRCMQYKPVMKFDYENKEMVQETALVKDEENGEEKEVGLYTFDSAGANKANEMLAKHIGFFEKDNTQKPLLMPTTIAVEIVQPKK